MKTALLVVAAVALAAGCASSPVSPGAPAGAGMGIIDNALISTRMNTIEAESYRSQTSSWHELAGLEDKTSQMEQKARRDAERRKNYQRTVPHSF